MIDLLRAQGYRVTPITEFDFVERVHRGLTDLADCFFAVECGHGLRFLRTCRTQECEDLAARLRLAGMRTGTVEAGDGMVLIRED